jgi:two-component system OmpR family sensor kinase
VTRLSHSLTHAVDARLAAQLADVRRERGSRRRLGDPDERVVVQILDSRGGIVRTTPGQAVPLLGSADLARVRRHGTLARSGSLHGVLGEWRVRAAELPGGRTAVTAASLRQEELATHRVFVELALAGAVALLVAAAAGYAVAAAALRPVEAMRRRASQISAAISGRRLPVPEADDELARLGTTLNELLDRVEAAAEHERRFVADASHELRTPLALLKVELDLALRRPRTLAELDAALRSAAHETDRLVRLAEDLLLVARADRGALALEPERVAVADAFTAVAERFGPRSAALGRTIEVEAGPELAVAADRLRLEQALVNLVDNALEHGAGTVRLEARRAGEDVELHVRDAGPGFPDAFLPRAFERFSRADPARAGGGSGLGLSIVEAIAAGHGGAAGAANTDAGADVWLVLPSSAAGPVPSHRDLIAAH